jgi:endonuclease YncB( thermonuclease family)
MVRPHRIGACLAIILLAGAGLLLGSTQAGGQAAAVARVLSVQDGDTLTVDRGDGPERVRLAEIDAPEDDQPHGRTATRALERMVEGRSVQVTAVGEDRYGRTLARLYVGGAEVNKSLVRGGDAWVYRAYSKDPAFPPLEAKARSERVGLWARPGPVAPWDWRKGGARGADRAPSRSCSQISSCDAAKAALRRFGPEGLDGDRDGVPCERLCRAERLAVAAR